MAPPTRQRRRDVSGILGRQQRDAAVLAEEERPDLARETLTSWGVTHSFLIDRSDATRAQTGATALPTAAIVDAIEHVTWLAATGATADPTLAVRPGTLPLGGLPTHPAPLPVRIP
ncbi:MAG: hypothetical protein JW751_30280 [Polyangiaceae bacterium]|nr:hypothetical protein [Polyangiaceae bacterium]